MSNYVEGVLDTEKHDILMRRTSCDKQWDNIKNKLIKWKETGQRKTLKQFVEDEIGITRRLQTSDKALSELLRDGAELITNIRVANDKREVDHRSQETEERNILLSHLQIESVEASLKLEVICKKWLELDTFKDPMSLFEGLESQRKRISELMKQKDAIIHELHDSLHTSDQRYYMDQEKQSADIYGLVERIDSQVDVMKHAYREHLELLQTTTDEERRIFKELQADKWQQLYEQRETFEQDVIRKAKDVAKFYESEIKRITIKHEELTRSTKIRLELDNDALQVELQNVKAEVMLNSEKLSYNYRVLQKRTEENLIIKNQQKRRLAKLNEIIAAIKNKINVTKNSGQDEIAKLTQEVTKLHSNILEMETKASAFALTNDEKFNNVWKMSEREAGKLVKNVLQIDQIIFSQQLGIGWENQPNIDILTFDDIIKTIELNCLPKNLSGKPVALLSSTNGGNTMEMFYAKNEKLKLLQAILNKIATNTQWLIDDQIEPFLKPYHRLDKTLIKIENIFSALGIKTLENVSFLVQYFQPYMYCPNCVVASNTAPTSKCENIRSSYCSDHFFVLESKYVVPALRSFIDNFYKQIHDDSRNANEIQNTNLTIVRLINENDMHNFWQQYLQFFPIQKERIWIALEFGLNQYLNILKKREKLDTECEYLRQQNAELKHLLQRYLPAENLNKN